MGSVFDYTNPPSGEIYLRFQVSGSAGIYWVQSRNAISSDWTARATYDTMCESMGAVEKKLEEMEIEYARGTVEEGGIKVDQLFFHDPDGFMIEICNCDILPVIPLPSDMVAAAISSETKPHHFNPLFRVALRLRLRLVVSPPLIQSFKRD
ncbi:uncharacterized protein HKW66_Vig0243420 [Vigna angularis]|uniref:VOC domain-containing protein n=1 Tax=Phaseolus angularis TaxID=3914 RepID=A0A8T0JP73_PHAAN|nr:uncharacterized protein HKW66_Vig0243420 [Vigna angularis]